MVNLKKKKKKRQKLAEWIIKYDSVKCYLQETPFKYDRDILKGKEWKKIDHANINQESKSGYINIR